MRETSRSSFCQLGPSPNTPDVIWGCYNVMSWCCDVMLYDNVMMLWCYDVIMCVMWWCDVISSLTAQSRLKTDIWWILKVYTGSGLFIYNLSVFRRYEAHFHNTDHLRSMNDEFRYQHHSSTFPEAFIWEMRENILQYIIIKAHFTKEQNHLKKIIIHTAIYQIKSWNL